MHKIIGTLTVSDNYNRDLFRIHLYENCIKFDSKFAEGVGKIDELTDRLNEITELWLDKKTNASEVLKDIVLVMEVYHEDLKNYYFSDEDLNEFGKYVDLVPIDSLLMHPNEDATRYYKYLLRENMLTKIDKKSFEKNLKDESYMDLYLEIYNDIKDKNVDYYKYVLNKNFEFKTCSFILVDGKVVFGYIY
jgi:hypothetical protein